MRRKTNTKRLSNSASFGRIEAQDGNLERVVDANAEVKLTYKHIRTVSKSWREFNHYIERLYDRDLDRRAKYMDIRARDIGATSGPFYRETQTALSWESDDDLGRNTQSSFGHLSHESLSNLPAHPRGFQPHLFNTQTGQTTLRTTTHCGAFSDARGFPRFTTSNIHIHGRLVDFNTVSPQSKL